MIDNNVIIEKEKTKENSIIKVIADLEKIDLREYTRIVREYEKKYLNDTVVFAPVGVKIHIEEKKNNHDVIFLTIDRNYLDSDESNDIKKLYKSYFPHNKIYISEIRS